ncbi:MAG TPA: formate dehydrogenase accessory protein FdhE [Syntrophobacteria bacterium]|nr:formate dehydrogenase accessory protein FdhE [Syntrophobacteria bacterium]
MASTMRESPPAEAEARVEQALKRLRDGIPAARNVVDAFRPLLVERFRLRAELPALGDPMPEPPIAARFEQGVPLTTAEAIIRFTREQWLHAADRLFPPMELGFPKLRGDLGMVRSALISGELDPEQCLVGILTSRKDASEELTKRLGVTREGLTFAVSQIARPLIEKRAEGLAPLVRDLRWSKGYCPICGSAPGLSLLRGKEGQRWLRCALCAHEWRFARLVCPLCEHEGPKQLELYFVAGSEHDRAEACHACKRYLISVDLRQRVHEFVPEVAEIGLLHLDMLVQEKGFRPASEAAFPIS